jgi:hypothetical protein
MGAVDPKGVMKAFPREVLISYHIYTMEKIEKAIEELHADGFIYIQDLLQLGWAHYYTPAISLLRELFAMDEAHYPYFFFQDRVTPKGKSRKEFFASIPQRSSLPFGS